MKVVKHPEDDEATKCKRVIRAASSYCPRHPFGNLSFAIKMGAHDLTNLKFSKIPKYIENEKYKR